MLQHTVPVCCPRVCAAPRVRCSCTPAAYTTRATHAAPSPNITYGCGTYLGCAPPLCVVDSRSDWLISVARHCVQPRPGHHGNRLCYEALAGVSMLSVNPLAIPLACPLSCCLCILLPDLSGFSFSRFLSSIHLHCMYNPCIFDASMPHIQILEMVFRSSSLSTTFFVPFAFIMEQ